jgi:hypothetical protein
MRFAILILTAIVALFAIDVGAATAVTQHAPTVHGVLYYVGLGGGLALFGAALGTGNLTLADWAKRLDPDGKVPTIVELLNQSNEILSEMVWREGNLPTGHRTTVRTGLPAVAWRLLNQGVTPSKSTTAQIDEQCGMLEAWSEVDKDLLLLNGNLASFRLSEAKAFIESMNQEMASTLFYGNGGLAPEEFTGLAVRYSSTSASNGSNVILGGGSGTSDNSSIYLVAWGDETISGIFPKGSKAGLLHEDFGEVTVEMVAGLPGSRMRAMQERFQWKAGIALKDWRYVVRIANVDISDGLAASAVTVINAMEQAEMILPNRLGRSVFYMNRSVARVLRKQARMAVGAGGGLTFENYAGKPTLMFGETPIRIVDAILNTEDVVS